MSAQDFGHRLAQLRREKAFTEQRDVTRQTVAEAVGVSAGSVTRWENGEVFPGDETLTALAAFFTVNRAWLRYGEGAKRAGSVEVPLPRPAKAPASKRARGGR